VISATNARFAGDMGAGIFALVRMKARNPQVSLELLYKSQPSLFTEKKLIESLVIS
jgi:hypothetical protein